MPTLMIGQFTPHNRITNPSSSAARPMLFSSDIAHRPAGRLDRHAGHAGARPEGETHFRIEIVSASFQGLSRVERQRLVHRLLAAELAGRVHALSLATQTPEEAGN